MADWLRWIAWAPAVIAGGLIGARLGRWVAAFGWRYGDFDPAGEFAGWSLVLGEGFGLAAGSIASAWCVAPSGKAPAARVAAGALVFFCGWIGTRAFLAGNVAVLLVAVWAATIALPVTARGFQQPGTTRVPGR